MFAPHTQTSENDATTPLDLTRIGRAPFHVCRPVALQTVPAGTANVMAATRDRGLIGDAAGAFINDDAAGAAYAPPFASSGSLCSNAFARSCASRTCDSALLSSDAYDCGASRRIRAVNAALLGTAAAPAPGAFDSRVAADYSELVNAVGFTVSLASQDLGGITWHIAYQRGRCGAAWTVRLPLQFPFIGPQIVQGPPPLFDWVPTATLREFLLAGMAGAANASLRSSGVVKQHAHHTRNLVQVVG